MVLVEECGKGYMGVLYCFCNFSLFKQISKEKDLKKKKKSSQMASNQEAYTVGTAHPFSIHIPPLAH